MSAKAFTWAELEVRPVRGWQSRPVHLAGSDVPGSDDERAEGSFTSPRFRDVTRGAAFVCSIPVSLIGSERLQEAGQEWLASCGGGLTADALRVRKGAKSDV